MTRAVRIGSLDLRIFDDGMLKTSLDLLFDIDRTKAAELAGAQPDGSVFIPVNNFLFQRDGATVLIDAGAGNTMQPTLGKLPDNLRSGGVSPADVTHILLTHLHPDHANGLVDDAGHAIYPNAEIIVLAREHDFWMSDDGAGDSEIVRKTRARNRVNLAPYRERLRLLRDGEEVLGCTALCAPGHSPGHTCWRIAAGGEALLAWGDLVHLSRIQIRHPEAALSYDLDKELAKQSRRRVLDMAASEGLMIAGAHVDAPGLGHVVRKGATFDLERV